MENQTEQVKIKCPLCEKELQEQQVPKLLKPVIKIMFSHQCSTGEKVVVQIYK